MNKDCSTCIHKEGSCYPSTTIFDKDKTCKSYDPDYEGYIAELEAKLKHAEENCINKTCVVFQDKEDCVAKSLELEKENAELKCECRRCVYTDSPCILSDYGKDKNGMCDHFKDVFEELKNWKDEWQEQVQKATDEGYARTLQTMKLNKAKEIIRELVEKVVWFDNCFDLKAEAEQFLKE